MKTSIAILTTALICASCASSVKTADRSGAKGEASPRAHMPTGSVSESSLEDRHTAVALRRDAEEREAEKQEPPKAGAETPPAAPTPESVATEPAADPNLATKSATAQTEATVTPSIVAGVQATEAPVVSKSEVAPEPEEKAASAMVVTTRPAHPKLAGIPAEQSLKWLANGNKRYVTKKFRADGRHQIDRDRTSKGQHPHAIVLSCADSRVPPELVFDQGLGEIFTVRVAAEILDSSVIASLEYAVEHLGARLLVVMGHTKCGAVDAAMKTPEGESAGSESLDKLLGEVRPHLKTRTSKAPSSNLEVESSLNADGVARDLLQRSPLIKAKVEAGELVIKPALYWIDSGKVRFF